MPLYLIKDKLYRKGEQAVNAGNVEKDPAAGENFVNNLKEPFARREELCYDKEEYTGELRRAPQVRKERSGKPMMLSEIKEILNADVLWGAEHLDREVQSACGSDFMSDVLAFVKNQALLLTGLVNPQVVRTADMVEMKCIVFVRGKVPGEDIVKLAGERDIVVMTCPKRMYEACGLLYYHGLRGYCDGND